MSGNLRQNEYHGIILPKDDPKNQGRYSVHIPELHPLIPSHEGMWIKNHIHKWRYNSTDKFIYGEYKPLQPGTLVIVKFYEDDMNTGYIDRIISDQIDDCLIKLISIETKNPPEDNPTIDDLKDKLESSEASTLDRDDMYLLYKTPKYNHSFTVLEDVKGTGITKDLIPNSIHLYYETIRSTLIINEDGIHWYTDDNRGTTIKGQDSKNVGTDELVQVGKNKHLIVENNYYESCKKLKIMQIGKTIVNTAGESYLIAAGELVSITAPLVRINSETSLSSKLLQIPNLARPNAGENDIVKQNKLIFKKDSTSKDKLNVNYDDGSSEGRTDGFSNPSTPITTPPTSSNTFDPYAQ